MKKVNIEISDNIYNSCYWQFKEADQRYQIFFGGASSGKSFFLSQRCIIDILKGGRNYLIIRNVQATQRSSTFNQICKTIDVFRCRELFNINKTDLTITCKNGYSIIFRGLDDTEKLKSVTPAQGIITDIWIEEATEIEYNAFKQLEKRLRGRTNLPKRIILSFNPILKDHWIYKEFFGKWTDDSNFCNDEENNLIILKTTYKDNKFLTADDIEALENETDKYFYDVYTLGNWGVLGSAIFTNWTVEDLSEIKKTAHRFHNGLDFGYAKDPAAAVRTYYDSKRKTIYILDEIYEVGLTNDLLAKKVKEIFGKEIIVCDSAEPKSIDELKYLGINAVPARKGKDSILHGIQWLQQQKIIIDVRCQNTKNEFQKYRWREDKNGVVLPQPVDKYCHCLDSLRYATENEYRQSRINMDDIKSIISVPRRTADRVW